MLFPFFSSDYMITIRVLMIVPTPSTMSNNAPAIDIYLLNKGALFNSQPVSPPAKMINGEIAVPNPNRSAIAKLFRGEVNVAE
jgi:hypothetical protein